MIIMMGKKIKDNRIEIRITEEEYEMLQEMKQEFGASSSDILRKGLEIQYDMYKYSNYSMR
jgi:predicted CopG family antitoxin